METPPPTLTILERLQVTQRLNYLVDALDAVASKGLDAEAIQHLEAAKAQVIEALGSPGLHVTDPS